MEGNAGNSSRALTIGSFILGLTDWKAAVEEARAKEEADNAGSTDDTEAGDDYEEEWQLE